MDLIGEPRIGAYQILAPLGQGAHADVYRVRHVDGTFHALKILRQSSEEIRGRLLREGQMQRALSHPNIVSVTDLVEHRGHLGLVMDFVDGPSLRERLVQGAITFEELDNYARDILQGVAAAHEMGIVHRDLKPGNILLDNHRARVCDFGIAKALFGEDRFDGITTRTGSALGTPAYMAPEQIRDARRVDQRADVYSLGAVFYEMFTGQPPFTGDLLEVFTAIGNGHYIPIIRKDTTLPARICQAIDGAMTTDPDQRISSAGVMLAVWTQSVTVDDHQPAPLSLT